MSRRICAYLDDEHWKKAQWKNISWSTALVVGIDILSNSKHTKEELKEKIDEAEGTLAYLRKEMDVLVKKDTEAEDSYQHAITTHEALLRESLAIINRNIKFLEGRTTTWNARTGSALTDDEFLKLCKRYEAEKKDC